MRTAAAFRASLIALLALAGLTFEFHRLCR